MYNVLPLFKSHFSLGKSILTLEKPTGKDGYPVSIFELLKKNSLNTLVLVEDCISGLLQASRVAEEQHMNLVFGIRFQVCADAQQKDENILKTRARYIVFAKNSQGYSTLVKMWSYAAKEGFYYTPCIDLKTLKALWNDNVVMAVPFYDSFLYLNAFCSHVHVPELTAFQPLTFFLENNGLPFDDLLEENVKSYCQSNGHDIVSAQSIFYAAPEDYLAYVAFRCLHNRGPAQKCTLERPELDHMNSDEFNFQKWLRINQ